MENKHNSLPVYKLKIKETDNDKSEVTYIAMVDEGAIMLDWVTFSDKPKISDRFKFSVDKERRLIMGALMISDMPIYREKDGQKFYVLFDKEEIMKIVQKSARKKYWSNFNLMHDNERKTEGVYIIESLVVDSSRGVSAPKAFEGISEGSWLVTVKVDNEAIWNDYIKTGEFKGFSVEGIFDFEMVGEEKESDLQEIIDIVRGL